MPHALRRSASASQSSPAAAQSAAASVCASMCSRRSIVRLASRCQRPGPAHDALEPEVDGQSYYEDLGFMAR